ncbi:MAG TPA: o-succinylbenzoate synthase [Acidimicrobiales bacterium]|nr:o-succinylbenzoate synthase [Acidimicrobiales bacterium]
MRFSSMKLSSVELRRIRLPLVAPFRTGLGQTSARDALLVRVVTQDGEGWGECTAMAEPTYTSEYVEGAHHVIRHHLVPRLLAHRDLTAEGVAAVLAGVKGHPMAKCALEMAVLDAELRPKAESLAHRLGAVRDTVEAGVAVGLAASVPELLDTVGGYLEAGYRRVKLKVQPGWDVEPVRAVRERFGDVALHVDANGAYKPGDTEQLRRLDAFALVMIEQPFAPDELAAHADLAGRIVTPVCLDESITSAASAAFAIASGAATIVNVKAARVGGYLEARRVHDVCERAGVPVWCGGMLETGLGRAANLALAALPGFTLPGDLSASDRYYVTDITPPFILRDGHLPVPDGAGLGVEVIEEVVEACTTSVERVGPD